MNIPHKWQREIIAWANGKGVDERYIGGEIWHPTDTPKFNDPDYEFRIFNLHRELMDKWEAPQELKRVDWSKMPVDTLCETPKGYAYFSGHTIDGELLEFFHSGRSIGTNIGTFTHHKTSNISIIPNEWRVWFGGECPVPKGVMGDMRLGGAIIHSTHLASRLWSNAIIAYRITGLVEGYTE